METLLIDLCSSCDTHAAHALTDRPTQLTCGIFSCVRKVFAVFTKGRQHQLLVICLSSVTFLVGWGVFRSVGRTFAL